MTSRNDHPWAALNRTFHEPNRLAIMSSLSAAAEGLTFTELKEACGLTDGNLNRHLKALEEAQSIVVVKTAAGRRPRTTVMLSDSGREDFVSYLRTLENVLRKAAEAVSAEEIASAATSLLGKTAWSEDASLSR